MGISKINHVCIYFSICLFPAKQIQSWTNTRHTTKSSEIGTQNGSVYTSVHNVVRKTSLQCVHKRKRKSPWQKDKGFSWEISLAENVPPFFFFFLHNCDPFHRREKFLQRHDYEWVEMAQLSWGGNVMLPKVLHSTNHNWWDIDLWPWPL